MPQNEHNKLISVIPNRNHHVHIRVGDPISFDDLFEKYQHALIDRKDQTSWETKEHEKELYSAITKRIEEKLLDLEKEIRQDQQQGKLPQ
jgi:monolysocardiolipin acyltransferase